MTDDDVQKLIDKPLALTSAFETFLLVENHSESREDTEAILNAWLRAKLAALEPRTRPADVLQYPEKK